jgi:hypothetical protein
VTLIFRGREPLVAVALAATPLSQHHWQPKIWLAVGSATTIFFTLGAEKNVQSNLMILLTAVPTGRNIMFRLHFETTQR